jgi:hypothetical protein
MKEIAKVRKQQKITTIIVGLLIATITLLLIFTAPTTQYIATQEQACTQEFLSGRLV